MQVSDRVVHLGVEESAPGVDHVCAVRDARTGATIFRPAKLVAFQTRFASDPARLWDER